MKTIFIALRAAIFMSGFLLAALSLLLTARPLDAVFGWAPPVWLAWMGALAIAMGAGLVLTCGGFFVVRGRGTPALFDPPRLFVAGGPYHCVRNPMYLGGLLLVGGLALWWRSATLLLALPLILGGAHMLVTLYEEPVLRRKFGASYEEYCRRVPRWLPSAR